jgi:hypothetical protein
MEVDFDKEIDAMLRRAQRDAPVLVGDVASPRHLDADEISAFAENAMPEKSRALYMAHLADCDRCRKILSNLLVMNSEAAPVKTSPGVITIAERAPWYKRLFLFPNLAYVMGGLVLIFSAFLGYTIFQNSGGGDITVSQATAPAVTKGGPNFQEEPTYPAESESAANTMTNSAANISAPNASSSNASASAVGRSETERGPAAGTKPADEFAITPSDSSADTTAAAPPPPSAKQQPLLAEPSVSRDREAAKEKDEKAAATSGYNAKNDSSISARQQTQLPAPSAQSGPMRANENQYNKQLENLDRRSAGADKKLKTRDEESSTGTRAVGGKTFERKQGVWYDVTYQSRPTINVRRGSAEFSKLDAGLRSIANSLSGTAVIVWGAKAYRIQ